MYAGATLDVYPYLTLKRSRSARQQADEIGIVALTCERCDSRTGIFRNVANYKGRILETSETLHLKLWRFNFVA
jgi:hypothetical protein